MKFIIIPKDVYDMIPEDKRLILGIQDPRMSLDKSGVILHIEHYDKLFESVNMLKSNKDEDVTYPYPVYESPSPEFDIVLSSSDWSDGVNELQS